jgi:hypothetical protein
MTDTGMKESVHAPTANELKKGPVVVLTRPGWRNYGWCPTGFLYPIRFKDFKATVLKSHYDLWLSDDIITSYGMTVEKPKPKAQSKPKATKSTAAQKVAAKTPARKKAAPKK